MNSTCCRLVPVGLCFLVLFHGCLAQLPRQPQQSARLSGRSDCQIEQITAREPNRRQVSEAGFSEFWDSVEQDELECAGVQVVRHTINPKGLLLPYYPSTPELVYVVRGEGVQGTVLPGCEETFETSFPSEGGRGEFSDKHQRVYRYKEGDILALPAGAVHWTYNDGHTPIVVVALRDTSNVANQLDRNFRKFFLAGNPQSQQLQQQPRRSTGHPSKRHPGEQEPPWGQRDRPFTGKQQQEGQAEANIIYIISGSSRLQIVRNDGSAVFDGVAREGQLIVVPQDFAVIKKAGEQGCEWVAFKTNENAITTQLAGRFSYIRALPEDVLANSYGISHEKKLKTLSITGRKDMIKRTRSNTLVVPSRVPVHVEELAMNIQENVQAKEPINPTTFVADER
ncbi:hypothetical protein L1987_78701 [Smallanthus sonchifolius]|uniref:Uncharacterized protein n=1 Tax=Smallanthus sonchifolius TaxID=185202 RepID=A0ACB8ZD39_9ASTR|nr:hypothetical protein L1987_78701 [Smallanthus sonchifolius]